MSTAAPSLDDLQRWMQAVITHPDGVVAGLHSDAAAALPIARGAVSSVVQPSASLAAEELLAIYHRAYHARLIKAFQAMFPAFCRAAGEELSNDFGLDYLAAHPPTSFTIDDFGRTFPEHLSATRPDVDAGEREEWPDLLIELAALERDVYVVGVGPGMEGRILPDARVILALSPEELCRLRPVPAPCTRVLACRWPVHRYVEAVHQGRAAELPAPAASLFVMTRREDRVVFHDLAPAPHALLGALDGRRSIEEAFAMVSPGDAIDIGIVRDWLTEWAARGFLEAFDGS